MARAIMVSLAIFLMMSVAAPALSGEKWFAMREKMVSEQIAARGVKDARVLEAMRAVPRHLFVPETQSEAAYGDHPLPIGHRQFISQPYIVATMTELLETNPGHRVLEIGTGSGYQAAVLSKLVSHVYSIEIIPELAETARRTLAQQGVKNVTVITGDGYRGLPKEAPFDGILVTAAPEEIPPPLLEQLKVGGRLVIPVGKWVQGLKVVTKKPDGFDTRSVLPVRFVPMTGEAELPRDD